MDRSEAYPISYGVLGLLAFTGPMSGYDLKQVFDCSLAPMWNAAHSQIYNELRRLDRFGWVEMERHEQESRPDKKVYRITEAGLQALRDWQARQPSGGLQMRDEALLRFIFGTFAAPGDLIATLRGAIADHEARQALYAYARGLLPPSPDPARPGAAPNPGGAPDPFFVEMGRFAEAFEEMYLRQLREALAFCEARAAHLINDQT